jgi:hypothetical protein
MLNHYCDRLIAEEFIQLPFEVFLELVGYRHAVPGSLKVFRRAVEARLPPGDSRLERLHSRELGNYAVQWFLPKSQNGRGDPLATPEMD